MPVDPCVESLKKRLDRERDYRILLLVSVACLVIKVLIAATTFGTNDIVSWQVFAKAVGLVGPVEVYHYHFAPGYLYNHPPLVGFLLFAFDGLARLGIPLNFSLRCLSSVCDVISTFMIYAILLPRAPARQALWAALLVAMSPVLFVISGFHGNTDPIFSMLVLLSLYFADRRRAPGLAGAAIAVATSVKLVPVLVIPCLAAHCFRHGRRSFVRFSFSLAGMIAIIWLPAVWDAWTVLYHHVLGYSGVADRWWGIPQFASWVGVPRLGGVLANRGRVLIVLACAVLPSIRVWQNPVALPLAIGVVLSGFLLLSPAIGTQYFVWPLAAAYLVDIRWATAYNLLAGELLIMVYTRWSGGFPWNIAMSSPPLFYERVVAAAVWVALSAVTVTGVIALSRGVRRREAVESHART